jgi:uncharacterized protein YdaU (DUF1376 family)
MSKLRRRLPFMPWFHSDFIAATQGWTPLERFAYFMLLGAEWETGPLNADFNRLAAIVGVPTSTFKLLWKAVGKKFEPTDSGLVNDRLELHRQKSLDLLASRQLGAAKTNSRRGGQVLPFPQGIRDDR